MELEDGDLRVGRTWPTRNVFVNITIIMVGIGVLVCVAFPFVALVLGVAGPDAPSAGFFATAILVACVGAGLPIGVASYLLVKTVVRNRMGALSSRLLQAQHELERATGDGSGESLAHRFELPVDTSDEFGQTNAAFNYLVTALDAGHNAEQRLRSRLIEQAKLAALGTLTAGVAHEMKNPLNFVVNFTELNLELCTELREHVRPSGGAAVAGLEADLELALQHARRALAVMASTLEAGAREPVAVDSLAVDARGEHTL